MLSFDIEKERKSRIGSEFWLGDRAKFLDDKKVLNTLFNVNKNPQGSSAEKPTNEQVVQALYELYINEVKVDGRVHVETVLTAIGAVAGFSVQMGIREDLIKTGKLSEKQALTEVVTTSGDKYYFGDLINQGIAQPQKGAFSVWTIVAGAPHHLGKPVPDISPIFKRVSTLLGTPEYQKPDLPKEHMPHALPDKLLWKFWNISRNTIITNNRTHLDMPFIMALLAQRLILEAKDIIDPTLAAEIVMAAAIPMSKIDPKNVEFAYFKEYK